MFRLIGSNKIYRVSSALNAQRTFTSSIAAASSSAAKAAAAAVTTSTTATPTSTSANDDGKCPGIVSCPVTL